MWLLALCVVPAAGAAAADRDLLVVENNLKPYPAGHGEDPPPLGSLVRVSAATGRRDVLATRLQDPVWVASAVGAAFVSKFHAGEVVRVSLGASNGRGVVRGLAAKGRSWFTNK